MSPGAEEEEEEAAAPIGKSPTGAAVAEPVAASDNSSTNSRADTTTTTPSGSSGATTVAPATGQEGPTSPSASAAAPTTFAATTPTSESSRIGDGSTGDPPLLVRQSRYQCRYRTMGQVVHFASTADLQSGDDPDDDSGAVEKDRVILPVPKSSRQWFHRSPSLNSTRFTRSTGRRSSPHSRHAKSFPTHAALGPSQPPPPPPPPAVATAVASKGRVQLQNSSPPTVACAGKGGEIGAGTGTDDGAVGAGGRGTFRYQAQLPKLEIPPLEETLERYLAAVAPLLSPKAFSTTKAIVQEFKTGGEGEALQQALLEYSANKDSYVEDFWNDSYLTPKASVVLHLNPFFVFETPTLSTHTRDGGGSGGGSGEVGRSTGRGASGGDGQFCSSCGGVGGGGPPANGLGLRPVGNREGGGSGKASPDLYGGSRLGQRERFPGGRGNGDDGNGAAGAANRQARRAASLLFSSLRFVSAVKGETLPPDVWRDVPLCMSQYQRLFGTHRKAVENDPDEMVICEDSRHVVVLCRNQFYTFSALHPDGRVGITEEELEEIVLAIQEEAADATPTDTAALAVGVLTTETRDDWAVARKQLAGSGEHNKRYLHLVDTALFVLCLDHTSPASASEIASSCLHGSYALEGDVQVGTCTNRWYDKLQLIVFENGAAGVNFEHTLVDGHTVLRFASDVFADVIYRFANHLTSTTGSGKDGIGSVFPVDERPFTLCEGRTPRKIEWRLSPELRRAVYVAETRISDLIRQHDVQVLEYDTFGKRFITANKMSPDALVQMGIVFGYYGLYGDIVAAYEPVLTKRFLKGRTEALRTVTAEVKSFLETFSDPDTTVKRKMLSLRSAIVSHGRLVKLAAKGKGVDRHLFALLCMAQRQGSSPGEAEDVEAQSLPAPPSPTFAHIPAIFEDEGWRVLNHVILSTSNCGNPSLRLFGFGPVVRDGFGVGYIIKENQLQLVVTSKNRQTDRFVCKIRHFFDLVYGAYSPAQIERRVRVASASESSEESGGYSMWGSFANRGEQPLI